MTARDRSPACSGLGQLLEGGDAMLSHAEVGAEQVELAARMVARHARTPDDGDMLAEALGLDDAAEQAGQWRLAGRIMQLADSIGTRP